MTEQPEENGTPQEQPQTSELIEEMLGEEEVETVTESVSESKTEDEPKEPTVTEEFAREYGLPKGFIGKPYDEIGKAYKEANKTISKLGQEKSNLEKQINGIGDKKTENNYRKKLDELPDPIDDLEGWKEGMAKIYEDLENLTKPQPKSPEEVFVAELSSRLPKGTDIDKLIEDFRWDNEDEIEQFKGQYANAPLLLARDIVKYHNSRQKEIESKQNAKVKHEKTVEKFDKRKTASSVSSQSRQTAPQSDLLSSMLDSLESNNLNF
jgi:hypothetical protein